MNSSRKCALNSLAMTSDLSPYKGLQPFTEADRPYFFGRERDQEIIASNLYAAPLTILYGSSGVGKSSVLMAGVVPQLRQTPHLAPVVFRTWQDPLFISALKGQIADAVSQSTGKSASVDVSLPLDEFLLQLAHTLRGSIFCLFDQFEEYFLYHEALPGEEGFDAEFARSINRRDVAANFLLAMREDSLSKLDRFKGRIPNLLTNMLRLEHLDHDAASRAIRNPLAEYNRHLPTGQPPMTIEDELVEAVIQQVRTGHVSLDQRGAAPAAQAAQKAVASGQVRVETPYLQLVMTRLWEEERKARSNTLHLATLNKLGGANQIVRTHLDATMAQLSNADRLVAARAFRFLVTPSGTKIAYTVADLANYADVAPKHLAPALVRLSSPEVRVLRAVAAPSGEAQEPRYEIYHDVLAPAILDWRERYLREERGKRFRIAFLALGIASVLIIGVLAVNLWVSTQAAQSAQSEAVQKGQEVATSQAQGTWAKQTSQAVGARATQVAQARSTREHTDAQQDAQTETAAAVQVAQAAQTQDARAQEAEQAAQTQAANAAAISQAILRTPAPQGGGESQATALAARATAVAVGTSAAQVLQFTVTGVTAAVSPQSGTTCPATFGFSGTITANQAGTVTYRWVRSDRSSAPLNYLTFTSSGGKTVTDSWTLSFATSGWERLQILAPESLASNQAAFALQPLNLAASLRDALAKNSKVSASLGCPQGSAQAIDTVQQVYQNGLMLWRKDTLQIYALLTNGAWSVYADTWVPPQREGGYFTPPAGLIEPQRGFGKVWRERLGGPTSQIGWATSPEVAVQGQVQIFDNGFAFIDEDGEVKILLVNGNWIGL